MVFDDIWMSSVQTVINFILMNRQYEIVSQPIQNMTVLKKLADDNRDWHHFENFVSNPKHGRVASALRQMVLQVSRTTGTESTLRRIRSKFRF
jgi:hypothetical protein